MTRIVRGDASDLTALMPVMTSAFDPRFGESWTEKQCVGVVSTAGSSLFIAKHEAVVGFALVRILLDQCEVMLLAVRPQAQQRGVGMALLDAVIADAKRQSVTTVFLEVRDGNPATKLYTSAGFAQVGRRSGYYRGQLGETFDALTFMLKLS